MGAPLETTKVRICHLFLHFGVTFMALAFINSNINQDNWKTRKAYWFKIFKEACATEKAFFSLASTNFPDYKIVDNGTYEIQGYRNDYFLVSGANSVTTEKTKPKEGALVRDRLGSYTVAVILTLANSGS